MKKILVVRFKQIGDAILSSVICSSLKESYPNSQIDYVVYEHIAPLFENQPHIDNVIVITEEERKNFLKYIAKVWKVTRTKYDIVIDIMSTPKSEFFTLFSPGAKFRIGRKKSWRGYTYTHRIKEPSDDFDKAEKFLQMLKPIEESGSFIEYNPNYFLNFSGAENLYMREKMEESGLDFNKLVIAFSINSRRSEKVYPIENMVEIIKGCLEKYDCQIIFYYSPAEKEFAKSVHRTLGNDARVFSNIETKSIRELGNLLQNCDMFVGNEGGPRHMAQAIDIPSFAIFSPSSSKKQWLSKNNERHTGVEPCEMNSKNYDELTYVEKYKLITPEYVLMKIDGVIKKFIAKGKKVEKNINI
ncbi:glycosyltransferase family 9 protein [Cetobacterium sp. 2A]|uniref:glycosyltransferase family 9 protein n=1 Tax=Cetobacterium sp. 2A TaxID=2754723 RepID=UPI00163D1BC0|nr:glycosyltransferase family 9 protein [Cetobacterium sp. 2A]MBC2856202.1 glycosyltransferase family 9 protein [Cetobacterium sp. 2A]